MHGDPYDLTNPFRRDDRADDFATALEYANGIMEEYDRMAVVVPGVDFKYPVVEIKPIRDVSVIDLAEQFTLEGVQPSHITEIFNKVTDFFDNEQIRYDGDSIMAFADWLDNIAGEVAYYMAFPNRMPNWKLHYLGED